MKKGFTLIEVLITLALFMVMLSLVMPIFISNFKTLNKSDTKMSISEEAQKTIDAITEKAQSAEYITDVKDSIGNDVTSISNPTDISSFQIKSYYKDAYTTYNFSLSNGILSCEKVASETGTSIEVSKYVSSISISPVPYGTVFDNCKGLYITVNTSSGGFYETLQSTVYFRNHD